MSSNTKDTVQENEANDQTQDNGQAQEEVVDELSPSQAEANEEPKKKTKKSEKEKLREALEELTNKNEELRDKYLRLFADFDNYKKRVAKEKLEMLNEAGKNVIQDLLPVMDDFSRALKTVQDGDNVEAVRNGAELILNKLKKTLEQKGLKGMESIGQDFDPEFHEAITEVPAPSEDKKGKVVDEIEKGYYLNDKIIRYAKVVVGK